MLGASPAMGRGPGYPLQFPAPGGVGEFRFYPLRGRKPYRLSPFAVSSPSWRVSWKKFTTKAKKAHEDRGLKAFLHSFVFLASSSSPWCAFVANIPVLDSFAYPGDAM
jgi:hypothetical protein